MKKTKRFLGLFLAVLSAFSIIACAKPGPIILKNVSTTAKNVILMIGDGMGPGQIKAGGTTR